MFFLEESRAAEELKNVGKIQSKDGPLNVLVKPSPPPKSRDGGGGAMGGGGASGGGRPRQPAARFSQPMRTRSDDDTLMEEDPTQVLGVSLVLLSIVQ